MFLDGSKLHVGLDRTISVAVVMGRSGRPSSFLNKTSRGNCTQKSADFDSFRATF